jgi:hypothetical protein
MGGILLAVKGQKLVKLPESEPESKPLPTCNLFPRDVKGSLSDPRVTVGQARAKIPNVGALASA